MESEKLRIAQFDVRSWRSGERNDAVPSHAEGRAGGGRRLRRRRRRVKTSSDVAAVMKRAEKEWRQEVERKGREGGR